MWSISRTSFFIRTATATRRPHPRRLLFPSTVSMCHDATPTTTALPPSPDTATATKCPHSCPFLPPRRRRLMRRGRLDSSDNNDTTMAMRRPHPHHPSLDVTIHDGTSTTTRRGEAMTATRGRGRTVTTVRPCHTPSLFPSPFSPRLSHPLCQTPPRPQSEYDTLDDDSTRRGQG